MYDLPPPKDSLQWSLALLFDVCLQIGLGKENTTWKKWTTAKVAEMCNAADTTARNWKNGESGITDQFLEALIKALTEGEKYQQEWEYVIRNAQNKILKGEELKQQRHEYFQVRKFSTDRRNTDPNIIKYLERSDKITSASQAKSILNPNIAQKSESEPPKKFSSKLLFIVLPLAALITLLLISSDKDKTIIDNIKFCHDAKFSQTQNRCSEDNRVFKKNIEKIQMSFESSELKQNEKLQLKWYRYGEMFTESTKNWDQTFALDLKYGSTFIVDLGFFPDEKGFPEGRYNLRFYARGKIVNQAQFIIE